MGIRAQFPRVNTIGPKGYAAIPGQGAQGADNPSWVNRQTISAVVKHLTCRVLRFCTGDEF